MLPAAVTDRGTLGLPLLSCLREGAIRAAIVVVSYTGECWGCYSCGVTDIGIMGQPLQWCYRQGNFGAIAPLVTQANVGATSAVVS